MHLRNADVESFSRCDSVIICLPLQGQSTKNISFYIQAIMELNLYIEELLTVIYKNSFRVKPLYKLTVIMFGYTKPRRWFCITLIFWDNAFVKCLMVATNTVTNFKLLRIIKLYNYHGRIQNDVIREKCCKLCLVLNGLILR